MKDDIKAVSENVITLYKDNEVCGMVRRDTTGRSVFLSAKLMGFGEIGQLLGADLTEQEK